MKIEYLSEWFDSLIWCPSQLTRKFKNPETGTTEEVYCRWRHCNPWTFEIVRVDSWVPLGSGLTIVRVDSWVPLGSGLTQEDNVEDVHKFAEKLLIDYYTK